ncbi:MAG: anti-sigma factor RsbA family regulatory protein [Pseudonocardiaceae bacterium]
MTTAGAERVDHRLLEYGSDEEFVAGVAPFLCEGLEAGEPALVVASPRNLATMRDLAGSQASRVRFADSDAWGSGNVPARVLAVEWAVRKLLATTVRCRLIEEFTWRGVAQRKQWCRHEAAANLLHTSSQVSMLCTVDTRASPGTFLDDLRRTHPIIAPDRSNPDFVEPWTYLTQLDGRTYRPVPPHADVSTAVHDRDLSSVRQRVTADARIAGLTDYQTQCLALAATEIVSNAVHHAGTVATIKTWTDGSCFCCEVSDKGPGLADPIAAYRPPVPAGGRCGLWLARTFCDDLQIVSSETGTAVRMSFIRP